MSFLYHTSRLKVLHLILITICMLQIVLGLRHCRGGLVSSQKQFEFCHKAVGELMWGKPPAEAELDTWERVTKKKGKKKWKMFSKKDKSKEDKVSKINSIRLFSSHCLG